MDTLFLESSDRRVEIEIRPNVARSNGGNFHLALYRFDIAKTCHTCIKKPPMDLFPGRRPTDHFEVNFGFQMAVVENPGSVGLNGPAGISVKMGRNLGDILIREVCSIWICKVAFLSSFRHFFDQKYEFYSVFDT